MFHTRRLVCARVQPSLLVFCAAGLLATWGCGGSEPSRPAPDAPLRQNDRQQTTDPRAPHAPSARADQPNEAVQLDPSLSVQSCKVDGNENQQYFLIRHKRRDPPPQGYGLIVILPGGPGSVDFLPFCANVLAKYAVPDGFLVAELVAPVWRPGEDRIVWPSRIFADEKADFDTEAFLEAVVQDVGKKEMLDHRVVFTLGWSSSRHVLYSASTRVAAVGGSVIAMSRFLPDRYIEPDKVKGKSYFLYHSPDDRICPYREAELAVKTLEELGATAKLVSYQGGHGWVPFTFYADRIREGILWLKEQNEQATDSPDESRN